MNEFTNLLLIVIILLTSGRRSAKHTGTNIIQGFPQSTNINICLEDEAEKYGEFEPQQVFIEEDRSGGINGKVEQ